MFQNGYRQFEVAEFWDFPDLETAKYSLSEFGLVEAILKDKHSDNEIGWISTEGVMFRTDKIQRKDVIESTNKFLESIGL